MKQGAFVSWSQNILRVSGRSLCIDVSIEVLPSRDRVVFFDSDAFLMWNALLLSAIAPRQYWCEAEGGGGGS